MVIVNCGGKGPCKANTRSQSRANDDDDARDDETRCVNFVFTTNYTAYILVW